jgi:hypothetical protein
MLEVAQDITRGKNDCEIGKMRLAGIVLFGNGVRTLVPVALLGS